MIIWKDFILDPVFGAVLSDEIFEGESHDLNLMEEGRVANQETRQLPRLARALNTGCVISSSTSKGSSRISVRGAKGSDGLDFKSATVSKDAPAVVRLDLRNTGAPSGLPECIPAGIPPARGVE